MKNFTNHYLRQLFLLTIFLVSLAGTTQAQCPTATGDQVTYGTGSWIGYMYSAKNNFSAANYQGFITESEMFDESFCGNNCSISTSGSCSLNSENFSVRFKMRQSFSCGTYSFTIGGDDGVRLSVDGGATWLISDYVDHSYRTSSAEIYLNGTYNLVLEYFEGATNNRVSFSYALAKPAGGGTIAGDQTICDNPIDPATFTSVIPAVYCNGDMPFYQWQHSIDNASWTDVSGATSETYDVPAGLSVGTHYYRRKADNGSGLLVYSNSVTVTGNSPQGDEVSYGAGSWIGYAYDGVANFATNYQGYFTEPEMFDESFCGANCSFALNGCDLNTETFTVRLKMQLDLCGMYSFTIGGDDGVRLSLDGGATYLINHFNDQGYTTYTATSAYLDGTVDLVLDYYENGGGNRVSFAYSLVSTATGGTIAGDQSFCATNIDPVPFTSEAAAAVCGETVNYQWEVSTDNASWQAVIGATSETYDVPDGLEEGMYYYRRSATAGAVTLYSNTLTVNATQIGGDQVSYGSESWIGYAYDGANNFTNYAGSFTEPEIFDESFCGANCNFAINGCGIQTETFTVRLKMRKTFSNAGYIMTVGADDGVRLSIDGGATWLIDDYSYHGYRTRSSPVVDLNGTYDLVLEYFEGGGDNRVSFNYSSGPLPVTWSSFDGFYEEGKVFINWKTASELNNAGFEVERSQDGKTFTKVAWVEGNGTVQNSSSYSITDNAAGEGWYYYRIKQIDFDQQYDYSPLIRVYVTETPEPHIYPNPANEYLYISGMSGRTDVSVQCLDLSTFASTTVTPDNAEANRFYVGNLPAGTYLVVIKTDQSSFSYKVIID